MARGGRQRAAGDRPGGDHRPLRLSGPPSARRQLAPGPAPGGVLHHGGGVMQLMIPGRTVLPYLFPAGALPMTMAVIFGPGMGVLTAFVTGTLAGYLGARGLELALFISLSGAISALVIGKAERLLTFFWAGVAGSLAAVAVIVVFRFPDAATDSVGKLSLLAAASAN